VIDVAVIGAAVCLPDAVPIGDDVTAAVFDDATDTWLLRTVSGGEVRARVIVDGARALHRPSPPNYPGRHSYRGPSLQCADRARAFDPAGGRVAVIGDRAAHIVGRLTKSEVQLFDCPPNWETRRRLPGIRGRARRPKVVRSPVDRITQSGLRTADGTDYDVDAIIYASASEIVDGLGDDALVGSRGLTIQQAWSEDATAYLGVAVHGFPNYFMVLGPDSPVGDGETVIDAQVRYILECLQWMRRRGSTRIGVRRSAQRQFTERARVKPPRSAFEVSSYDVDHEIYDGPATLTAGAGSHAVRARLTGHVDPIDGKYHWQGMLFGAEFGTGPGPVHLAIDSHTTAARITEQTPWGSYSIAGVGAPPFKPN
jgi:cation diffusion facilitator CzcD-associated flavoprotein CzcO